MLRRIVVSSCLAAMLYFGIVVVSFAQNRQDQLRVDQALIRLEDQTSQTQQKTISTEVRVADLERQIKEIQDQKMGERIAVLESTARTNFRFLIGLCLSMFPVLIDIFRRWVRKPEEEVGDDTD
jgi:uncharacterized protein YlxW (UPF0749 family)